MSRTEISSIEKHNVEPQTSKQEKKMRTYTKIEKTVLINGTRAADVTDENLQELIQKELSSREKVQETLKKGVKSKALDYIVNKHTGNISKLVEILDSRLESEDS